MTAPDLETKSLAPEWLRAANATLTAWTSFITTLAVFLVVIWLFPSSRGLAGTRALLLLVLMLSVNLKGNLKGDATIYLFRPRARPPFQLCELFIPEVARLNRISLLVYSNFRPYRLASQIVLLTVLDNSPRT